MPSNCGLGIRHIPNLYLQWAYKTNFGQIGFSHVKQLEHITTHCNIWPNATFKAPYMEGLQRQPMILVS